MQTTGFKDELRTEEETCIGILSPFPVPVICRILGVDDNDWKLFDEWADIIFSALDRHRVRDRAFRRDIEGSKGS